MASPAIATLQDAYRQCRDVGMRLSRQRRLVLELLWREKEHLSARDIFERLNSDGRSIGHTSVYQNLEALQSAGIIECIERASGRLYGYRSDPHSHLICEASGSILDLDVVLPEALLLRIEAETGYCITGYTLQLSGTPSAARSPISGRPAESRGMAMGNAGGEDDARQGNHLPVQGDL
ncbi:MAG: transcriptional repressor [Aphanocapsa feldmannii 277cV]|uniref:Transcriptional repressor n=2 Tax=Aphanocapsa feldmannii TaxID=192050 RepID=A0A524RPH0_9CHRO|nr:MAG: transcriptional repressor [Aphanocapsa feldmannii 277cV]